jgi:mersacidin/lichenicidin family type 2 lantibiotic
MFGVSRTKIGIKERKHIMSLQNIIRAWKDGEYRASLSAEERALLPEHPAGFIELADIDLDLAAGGDNFTINRIHAHPSSCGGSKGKIDQVSFVRDGRHHHWTSL